MVAHCAECLAPKTCHLSIARYKPACLSRNTTPPIPPSCCAPSHHRTPLRQNSRTFLSRAVARITSLLGKLSRSDNSQSQILSSELNSLERTADADQNSMHSVHLW